MICWAKSNSGHLYWWPVLKVGGVNRFEFDKVLEWFERRGE